MSPAILINLLFPIVTGLILWVMAPVEGSIVTYDFMMWFMIGACLQIVAGIILMQRTQKRWVLGWTLLWIASIAYMGSYAPAHMQDKAIGDKWNELKAPEPQFPVGMVVSDEEREHLVERKTAWAADRTAADLWFREQFGMADKKEDFDTLAQRDLAQSAYLLYVLAFAFLSAFFSISWFAGGRRLHEYGVSGGSKEEPLAPNLMGRESAEA